jgi:ribonuclease R
MADIRAKILKTLANASYKPLTPKAFAKRLEVDEHAYREFRSALKELIREGKAQYGKDHLIEPVNAEKAAGKAARKIAEKAAGKEGKSAPKTPGNFGTFQRLKRGDGVIRIDVEQGQPAREVFVDEKHSLDAASGDTVRFEIFGLGKKARDVRVRITAIEKRAMIHFVGTFSIKDGTPVVRVDGAVFTRSVVVPDAATKGVLPDDKVVIEMIRFPVGLERGEGVILEILGRSGDPRVDTLSVVRALGIPEQFSEAALSEARAAAAAFDDTNFEGREDFTQQLVITIDPVDAKDFDDAVSLEREPKTGHWLLTVHIADVTRFVASNGALDLEARDRATSVYLPQRVVPMLPELISNGLASLQEGKIRFVKTARMQITDEGQLIHVHLSNGVIRNRKRFTYEQVQAILKQDARPEGVAPEIIAMLQEMLKLSLILRARRRKRGALELSMPETVLEYGKDGNVSGAHFAVNDESHQLIESFMLAANEAVATHLSSLEVPFLRRVHPSPNEPKLEAFSEFARHLEYKLPKLPSRFDLQRVLEQSVDHKDRYAIHYAMLRSLKQAAYSPVQDEHFALASSEYCHFTSPIRRYPDLHIHRLVGQWIEKRKVKSNLETLTNLGFHCSNRERRAQTCEREAVRLRILAYLSDRIGDILPAVITGVTDYGFYAQGTAFPAEGLVHISGLTDDFYHFDSETHTLEGRRTNRRYRLGDELLVELVRVDLKRRQLDFRVHRRNVGKGTPAAEQQAGVPASEVVVETAEPPKAKRKIKPKPKG